MAADYTDLGTVKDELSVIDSTKDTWLQRAVTMFAFDRNVLGQLVFGPAVQQVAKL